MISAGINPLYDSNSFWATAEKQITAEEVEYEKQGAQFPNYALNGLLHTNPHKPSKATKKREWVIVYNEGSTVKELKKPIVKNEKNRRVWKGHQNYLLFLEEELVRLSNENKKLRNRLVETQEDLMQARIENENLKTQFST
jgi:hypothetical protein